MKNFQEDAYINFYDNKMNIISKDNKVSNLIAPFLSGQEKFLLTASREKSF